MISRVMESEGVTSYGSSIYLTENTDWDFIRPLLRKWDFEYGNALAAISGAKTDYSWRSATPLPRRDHSIYYSLYNPTRLKFELINSSVYNDSENSNTFSFRFTLNATSDNGQLYWMIAPESSTTSKTNEEVRNQS
eukprot:UN34205